MDGTGAAFNGNLMYLDNGAVYQVQSPEVRFAWQEPDGDVVLPFGWPTVPGKTSTMRRYSLTTSRGTRAWGEVVN